MFDESLIRGMGFCLYYVGRSFRWFGRSYSTSNLVSFVFVLFCINHGARTTRCCERS